MKKTLTTALALLTGAVSTSLAGEEWSLGNVTLTVEDAVFANNNTDTLSSGNGKLQVAGIAENTLTSYTIFFQLTADTIQRPSVATHLFSASSNGTGEAGLSLTLTLNGTLVFSAPDNAGTWAAVDAATHPNGWTGLPLQAIAGDTYQMTYDAHTNTAFLTNFSKGRTAVWKLADSQGTANNSGNYVSASKSLVVNGNSAAIFYAGASGAYPVKVIGVADLSDMESWQIRSIAPEPATATLSLLALAGLAARRRRK